MKIPAQALENARRTIQSYDAHAREYNAIVERGVSYGIHHCVGSWRNPPMMNRIKTTFWRVARKFA